MFIDYPIYYLIFSYFLSIVPNTHVQSVRVQLWLDSGLGSGLRSELRLGLSLKVRLMQNCGEFNE